MKTKMVSVTAVSAMMFLSAFLWSGMIDQIALEFSRHYAFLDNILFVLCTLAVVSLFVLARHVMRYIESIS